MRILVAVLAWFVAKVFLSNYRETLSVMEARGKGIPLKARSSNG